MAKGFGLAWVEELVGIDFAYTVVARLVVVDSTLVVHWQVVVADILPPAGSGFVAALVVLVALVAPPSEPDERALFDT
eukprot:TRINITY_DN10960_c0_g1_i1.p3 TRINITY_DN10960_c0_g1~~TRINITY_DN10960_c0_g1_i1.p3  ORF type:complete len:78 (-),score=16.17 TRINITY_DN10960_c0_g1_i1:137-370(-)